MATLRTITSSLIQVEADMEAAKAGLKDSAQAEQWSEIRRRLVELDKQRQDLVGSFEEIASGQGLGELNQKPDLTFDWDRELKDLMGPIIHELRSLTERPRELEGLRRDLDFHRQRLARIQGVLARLAKLREAAAQSGTADQALTERLAGLEKTWSGLLEQTQNALAVVEHQLNLKLSQRTSFWESAHKLFALFFKSRGRNLILALLAALFVFLAARLIHRLVYRFSPWHQERMRSFYVRVGDVVYYTLTVFGAVGAFLLVLFLFDDWVLLGLSLILLFGLAWAARKGLPVFWQQAQMLLNLGTVREGERVVLNGLPWKVETINIYTHLRNPVLEGGRLRLPIRDLIGLRSRPVSEGEAWFPCQKGDWILLSEADLVKVVGQTPEFVEAVELGGGRRVIPTADFLAARPVNISTGFRIWVTFGLDYQHQALITAEAPEKLRSWLARGLEEKGLDEHLNNLQVEFKEAGASSLDLQILADFAGPAAPSYRRLQRALNRLAVEACNHHGWVIPFTQITLHQADPHQEKEAGERPPEE